MGHIFHSYVELPQGILMHEMGMQNTVNWRQAGPLRFDLYFKATELGPREPLRAVRQDGANDWIHRVRGGW